jgi:transcriptional regulator with XRE-family HTH domain
VQEVEVREMEGRFWVKLISREALKQYMKHRGFTIRSLAARVGCSRALIGHLCSGERATCMPATARAVEKALDAPAGSLFVPQVSSVVRNGRAA